MAGVKRNRLKTSSLHASKIVDNIHFAFLALPAAALLFVFAYIPMSGIVIAFKHFRVTEGVFGSPWVGFKNFEFFFKSADAWRTIRNTLGMNFLLIVSSLICNIAFALLCYYLRSRRAIKTYQTITIIPSFLSWVVVGYLVYALLKPSGGIINQIITFFGGTPVKWYSEPYKWPALLVIINLWRGVGYGSLFYFASLMGIEHDYFEVAALEGANRWHELRYIILPHLLPLIIIMQILAIGNIFRADFGLFFNVTRDAGPLYPTTDVIDTYIYRALMKLGDIGMSSAAGLFQSVVGFVLILATNLIVKRIDADYALF